MTVGDDYDNELEDSQESQVHRRGGLSRNLWRLAIVIGVAQFSMSVWSWQFGIYMETLLEFWQMGLTFSIGTFASIIGFLSSGIISDLIGRKKTLLFAFLPMGLGMFLMVLFPIWPLFPLFYGVVHFGWSFILITARAGPADQIAQDKGKNAAKVFIMVLVPAFLMDGISPLFASLLLILGFEAQFLLVIGGAFTVVSAITAIAFFRETLTTEVKTKAREGPIIAFRGLGSNFWKLVCGTAGFSFAFNMAFPYLGNLIVNDWGIDDSIFGIAWGLSSISVAILTIVLGGLADKRVKRALIGAIIADSLIMFGFSFGSGILFLFVLNILWAIPIVVWIGAERALIVEGVGEEMQGRALGTYQVIMSSIGMAAQIAGSLIWTVTGSLRYLWLIASVTGFVFIIVIILALRSIKLTDGK